MVEVQMETIFLTVLMVSWLSVVSVDIFLKRRKYLQEQG